MNSEKIQFEHDVKGLLEEVYQLNSYYILNKYLKEKTRDKDNLRAMNKAPAFFQLTLHSSQSAAILGLAKLYEPARRKSKGLFKFLNFIDANHKKIFSNEVNVKEELGRSRDIDHRTVKEHINLLQELSPIIENLIAWRDKSYAHHDIKFFKKQDLLVEEFPITYSEFEKLIVLAGKILNEYQVGYNGKTTVIEPTNILDVDIVLRALKNSQ